MLKNTLIAVLIVTGMVIMFSNLTFAQTKTSSPSEISGETPPPVASREYLKKEYLPGATTVVPQSITGSETTASCLKTGCDVGLECIQFPGNEVKCAAPNPCSYYKCPTGTECFVSGLGAGRPESAPVSSPVSREDGSTIKQVPESDTVLSPAVRGGSVQGNTGNVEGIVGRDVLPFVQIQVGEPTSEKIDEEDVDGIIKLKPLPTIPSLEGRNIVGCRAVGMARPLRWGALSTGQPESSGSGAAPSAGGKAEESTGAKDAATTAVFQTKIKEEFDLVQQADIQVTLPPTVSEDKGDGGDLTGSGSVPGSQGQASVSIWGGSSGEKNILQTKDASAEYAGKLVIEERKLYMETPGGKKQIEILPDAAVAVTKTAVEQSEVQKIELKEDAKSQVPVYEIKTVKAVKLFGFVPLTMKIETNVSAENGKVMSIKKPWWSFLTR